MVQNGNKSRRRRFLKLSASAGVISTLPVASSTVLQLEDGYESDFEIRPFSATAPDGIALKGHVYLPENEDPPYGTVLYFSPYWNGPGATPSNDPPSQDYWDDSPGGEQESVHRFGGLHRLINEGFAIGAVNMRGTGISEGCLQWASPVDQVDGYTVVETLAEEPWSNGKIGMYGLSYDAVSQTLAMAANPPSLKATLPVDGGVDLWKFFTQNGAANSGGHVYPPAWDVLTGLSSIHNDPDRADCPNRPKHWTQPSDWAISGDKNGWFQRRDHLAEVANNRIPMFYCHGQLAGKATTGHTLQIEGLYEARPPNTTRMALGDWGHNFQRGREEFIDQVVHWFDHYLRDGPKRVKPGIVEYRDDTGSWYTAKNWPPRADDTQIFLSGGSLVRDENNVQPSQRRFQSEDSNSGLERHNCGPRQVVYASPPLRETVRLAGNATVATTLTSTLSGGNYVAKLFHTPGSGSCPDSDATEFTRLLANLRHWKTPGRAQRFPVNEPTEVTFDTQAFATEVPRGNRIVLVISGGDTTIQPRPNKPLITVSTGNGIVGNIDLPVIEGTLTLET